MKVIALDVECALRLHGSFLTVILRAACFTSMKTVWPSGLRRQTQVLVEKSAWVRTPQLSVFCPKARPQTNSLLQNTPDRTRTGNLWIRSPTRYPLRHGGCPLWTCHCRENPFIARSLRFKQSMYQGPTARLAQSVERKALNLVVVGSSPTVGNVRSNTSIKC